MQKNLVHHFEEANAFNDSQHGFRRGSSCLSQLLAHHNEVLENLENSSNADVIYIDFAKAFDKVDFNVLLLKLENIGVKGKLHNWIKSFIAERTQSVVVKEYKSKAVNVTSGVPQGNVLGPLLFLVLTMDIDKNLKFSILKSFADDTRVAKRIEDEEDAKALQLDLEKVYEWPERNNMEFNSLKFELLRYGDDDEIKTTTQNFNSIRTIIEEKHVVRDLGIIMNHDATFTEHIETIVSKAQSTISSICRCFKTRTPEVMIQLWKSLVIPHLD